MPAIKMGVIYIDEVLTETGEKIVERLVNDIENKSVTKYGAVNASGNLAKSIRFEVTDGVLRVYAADYIYYLVYGRKPGKFPPREPILQWIRDKGINPKIPINSLAYLIQRKIARAGTTIYEQGGSTLLSDILNQGLIDELRSDMLVAAIDNIVTEIGSDIIKIAA